MHSLDSSTSAPVSVRTQRRRLLAILVGLVAAVIALAGCGSSGSAPSRTVTKTGGTTAGSGGAGGSSSTAAASSTAPAAKTVKITTLNSDGETYGVGMPVIVFFGTKITDGKAWEAGTKVTANGAPLEARWYFETSSAGKGPIEAHLRPENYWPAHAQIHITFPAKGTSLGAGLQSDGVLTSLDFSIGARNISTVDNSTHMITVVSDGKQKYKFPVSLGASNTPTLKGVKVIMEKGRDISMRGPGYYDAHVKYTQRLTYAGEYLHAAPWNEGPNGHIGRSNSSNGCTNLTTANAITLYNFLKIGDVVTFPNADGPPMTLGAGYGDWNLSWASWKTGGLVSTTA